MRHVLPTAALAMLAALGLPATSAAQNKTSIDVLVASVSTGGKDVASELAGMAKDFKRERLPFTSFKLISRTSLSLGPNQSENVRLPNGNAQFTLVKLEGNAARLKIATPFMTSTYTMKPGGEMYIDGGAHGSSKVYLAVKR